MPPHPIQQKLLLSHPGAAMPTFECSPWTLQPFNTSREQSHAIATQLQPGNKEAMFTHAIEGTALLMDAMLLHAQFSTSSLRQASSNTDPSNGHFKALSLVLLHRCPQSRLHYCTQIRNWICRSQDATEMDPARACLSPGLLAYLHSLWNSAMKSHTKICLVLRDLLAVLVKQSIGSGGVYWAKLPQDAWEAEKLT